MSSEDPPRCYRPDGSEVDGRYAPCRLGGTSMCCRTNDTQASFPDICRSDGLCQETQNTEIVWRESCTDPTWQAPECLQLCVDGSTDRSNDVAVTFCADGSICCGLRNDRCCLQRRGVFIVDGKVVSSISTSSTSESPTSVSTSTSTSTTGSSASPSLTVSTSPPITTTPTSPPALEAAASPPALSTAGAIGIGVGIGALAIGICVVVVLFLLRKRKMATAGAGQAVAHISELPGPPGDGDAKNMSQPGVAAAPGTVWPPVELQTEPSLVELPGREWNGGRYG